MALPASQQFLQFETIRDGVVVLPSGDLRAILMVSAINFALKSQEEQEAIIFAFQNFLNSLDFDLQIVIHSRKMNIKPYLDTLQQLKQSQENDLLRVLTEEYIEFISNFVQEVNVMTKSFYVGVPFSLQAAKAKVGGPLSAFSGLTPFGKPGGKVAIDPAKFPYYKNELLRRVGFVIQGLHPMGLRATMLSTAEVVELLWALYNPEKADSEEAPTLELGTLAQELI